jgi:hypothetical protein
MEKTVGALAPQWLRLLLSALVLSSLFSSAGAQSTAESFMHIEPFQARYEALLPLPLVVKMLGSRGNASAEPTRDELKLIKDNVLLDAPEWCVFRERAEQLKPSRLEVELLAKDATQRWLPVTQGEKAVNVSVAVTWYMDLRGMLPLLEVVWKNGLPPGLLVLPVRFYFGGKEADLAEITEQSARVKWENKNRMPVMRVAAVMPVLKAKTILSIPVALILWLLFSFLIWIWVKWRRYKFPGGVTPFFAVWLLGAMMFSTLGYWEWDRSDRTEQAQQSVKTNVYRAFEFGSEYEVKQRLEGYVSYDAVNEVYQKLGGCLQLDANAYVKASAQNLSAYVSQVQAVGEEGFSCEVEWSAVALGMHWGHSDQKALRMKAIAVIEHGFKTRANLSDERTWKLKSIEIKEQKVF